MWKHVNVWILKFNSLSTWSTCMIYSWYNMREVFHGIFYWTPGVFSINLCIWFSLMALPFIYSLGKNSTGSLWTCQRDAKESNFMENIKHWRQVVWLCMIEWRMTEIYIVRKKVKLCCRKSSCKYMFFNNVKRFCSKTFVIFFLNIFL